MQTNRLKPLGLFTGSCLAVVAVAVGLCLTIKQPAYDGHPMSYWFNELPATIIRGGSVLSSELIDAGGRKYGAQREKANDSVAAIQGIGAKGLPFIIWKLGRREPLLAKWLQACFSKVGVKRSLFPNPEIERAQAVTALLALDSLPPEATRQLRELSSNAASSIAQSAAYVLAANTNASLRNIIGRYH